MRVAIAVVMLVCLAVQPAVAEGLDDVLQILAWSANVSDYHQTERYVAHGVISGIAPDGLGYRLSEGNPMFADDPTMHRTYREAQHALIEVIPEVFKPPYSTLVLLGLVAMSGHAVEHNNRCLVAIGEGSLYAIAFRIRW